MTEPSAPLDLTFLDAQTFGDRELAREILGLFLDQARRLVPLLPDLSPTEQSETAHLLKGSCLGIGANRATDLLNLYGLADASERRAIYLELAAAFSCVEAAIAARLAPP